VLGPIQPETIVAQVQEGPPEPCTILIEPEDTLDLFVQWSGHNLRELLEWNPGVRSRGLVAGDGFRMVLTPLEFKRFSGARKAYLAEVRSRRELGLEIREVIRHPVQEGETLRDLLERYPTSLDLLEKMNPRIRLTGLVPGQVLNIPLLESRRGVEPALPGPKPPAPPPVPVPPPPPKPQTVQPREPPEGSGRPAVAQGARSPDAATTYVVQDGDRAWFLATRKFGVSIEALAAANPGVDLDRLRPGMRLNVPKRP